MPETGDWKEWSKYVLKELERIAQELSDLRSDINVIKSMLPQIKKDLKDNEELIHKTDNRLWAAFVTGGIAIIGWIFTLIKFWQ
jgi:septal ring factor EnvC (AmiA/AmiB activator)